MTGRVYGYLRVSTDEQADSGAGIAAQRRAISLDAERRDWTVTEFVEDAGWSGSNLDRPGIAALLPKLKRGDTLVVSKLDRLSRSLSDFATLMEEAKKKRWALVALDLGVDMTTPTGRMVAGMLANLAEWERALISDRTRDAMAAKKAAGGVRYGHRSRLPVEVLDQVQTLRDEGLSLRQVALQLTAAQVLTASGGTVWHPSSVRSALSARANDAQAGLLD